MMTRKLIPFRILFLLPLPMCTLFHLLIRIPPVTSFSFSIPRFFYLLPCLLPPPHPSPSLPRGFSRMSDIFQGANCCWRIFSSSFFHLPFLFFLFFLLRYSFLERNTHREKFVDRPCLWRSQHSATRVREKGEGWRGRDENSSMYRVKTWSSGIRYSCRLMWPQCILMLLDKVGWNNLLIDSHDILLAIGLWYESSKFLRG